MTTSILTHFPSSHPTIAFRTHALRSGYPRSPDTLPARKQVFFSHDLPCENLYSVMRRLNRLLRQGRGVIVANDWVELATTATYDTRKAVISVTHNDTDYYYGLATTFQNTIDAFVAVSQRSFDTLCALLPHRREDIHHIRTGVEIPPSRDPRDARDPRDPRNASAMPLRIIYAGRFDPEKRTTDLPLIAARLHDAGIACAWTLLGDGVERAAVEAAWPRGVAVDVRGRVSAAAARAALGSHDVFILGSTVEGLPVALLEAGAAGVVPIVSRIESGIPEVVTDGVTGMLREPGDVAGFADAIACLASDRASLHRMSAAVRAQVSARFDVRDTALQYANVAERAAAHRAAHGWRATGPFTGSRLDRRWLPNTLVRAVRRSMYALRTGR